MTRGTNAIVAVLVVLAAFAGAVGPVGAVVDSASTAAPTTESPAMATAAQEDCSFPATLTDASGTEVTLEESPEDVVVLGASTAQTVWEVGESEHVVGMPVGPSTAYLNGSSNRTHVLDGIRVQIETVVELEPDLVIAPQIIQPDDVQSLRDAGLTVYRETDASSLDAVRERTRTTGRLLGACDAADETVAWMNERLSVVDEAVEGEDRPSVLVWSQSRYVPGNGTFQGDMIARAGGDNAAENMGIEGWAQFEVEAAIEENPDYFLVTGGTSVPEDSTLQETTAGQEGNYVQVDVNYWNQPAPRVVLALESIAEQLHPEAYENATTPDENETESGDGTGGDGASDADGDDADEGSDDGTGDGSPGFGVPVAVAALLGSLLALRHRT
jgi:iron complex transport system substrate-binding protein